MGAESAPDVAIETERLRLRPLALGDLEELLRYGQDPEVTRYVTPLDRPLAEERLLANEREWAERGHGMFALLDRRDGRFLGRAGLRYWPQFDETELGWVLGRDAWGHGYATEAARACVDWGFASLPVPYLTAMIHPDNERSLAVARRLGMSAIRDDVLLGSPVIVHALRREEWAPAAPSGAARP